MRLGIDVDGVLADHVGAFCADLRDDYGVDLRPGDLVTWDVTVPGLGDDVQTAIDERTADPKYLRSLDSIEGAPKAMNRLGEMGIERVIVTHRPPETHDATQDWLRENDIPYDEYDADVPKNKGEADVDALIDDYHGNVTDALEAGLDAYLLLRPWNRRYSDEIDSDDILTDWADALDVFGRSSRLG